MTCDRAKRPAQTDKNDLRDCFHSWSRAGRNSSRFPHSITIHPAVDDPFARPLLYRLNFYFMAESVAFSKTSDRAVIYGEIVPQIDSLIAPESDLIANLANIAAVLKEAFGFFWVGFYLTKGDQ